MKLATPFTWGVKATGGREPYAYTAGRAARRDRAQPRRHGDRHADAGRRDAVDDHRAGTSRGTADTLQVTFTTQALLAFHKTKQPRRSARSARLYSWRAPGGRRLGDEDLPRLGQDPARASSSTRRRASSPERRSLPGTVQGQVLGRSATPGRRSPRPTGSRSRPRRAQSRAAADADRLSPARPPVSGRARMPRWTRFAVSSSSPGPGSTTRTSTARSCSSASTATTARWASSSTARPWSTVADAVPPLAELVEDDDVVHLGGPVQPQAVVVLADFVDPAHVGVARGRHRSASCPARSRMRATSGRSESAPRLRRVRRLGARPARGASSRRAPGSSCRRRASDVFGDEPERPLERRAPPPGRRPRGPRPAPGRSARELGGVEPPGKRACTTPNVNNSFGVALWE